MAPIQNQRKHGLETQMLRCEVPDANSTVAIQPGEDRPFPIGREFALSLGYHEEMLEALPSSCMDEFAGVSSLSIFAGIPKGSIVFDLGCGAELDSSIAGTLTGPAGSVIDVDNSKAMMDRARMGQKTSSRGDVQFCRQDAEHLPLPDDSEAVAMVRWHFRPLSRASDNIYWAFAGSKEVRNGPRRLHLSGGCADLTHFYISRAKTAMCSWFDLFGIQFRWCQQ